MLTGTVILVHTIIVFISFQQLLISIKVPSIEPSGPNVALFGDDIYYLIFIWLCLLLFGCERMKTNYTWNWFSIEFGVGSGWFVVASKVH